MKKTLVLLAVVVMTGLCLVLFTACTGEEGNTVELCLEEYDDWSRAPAGDPTSDDLQGLYDLVSFLVNYYEDGVLVMAVDENSGYSYSGTMDIDVSTITQDITFDGISENITASYTNAPIDTWSGIFTINESGDTYDVEYSISGDLLTTYSGLICMDVSLSAASALAVEEAALGALIGPYAY